jgi:hypothetical protein
MTTGLVYERTQFARRPRELPVEPPFFLILYSDAGESLAYVQHILATDRG